MNTRTRAAEKRRSIRCILTQFGKALANAEENAFLNGNGMIGYVAKERVDGKLILAEAVQILKINSSAS